MRSFPSLIAAFSLTIFAVDPEKEGERLRDKQNKRKTVKKVTRGGK